MIYHFNNSAIFYNIKGTGKPIVFLHGFLESSTMWSPIVSDFNDYQVILIDLPGHGKSDAIANSHTMELQAEVIFTILEKESINKATFVGHSMGGYVLLAIAEKYPEIISKLILLNSTSKLDNPKKKKNRSRAIEIIKRNKKAYVSMAISNLFSEENREKYRSEIEKQKDEASTFSTEGIIASIKGLRDRIDRTTVLKDFANEKYSIAGIEDVIIPIEDSRNIATTTNTTLFEVKTGHFSLLEKRKEIVKILHFIV
ncbi:alpha/beta fold hydrolase [Patiriisocius hiemis]|uniref:Alpha/beta hydrolase n=1 Tax=Patiriisocius hiemis TaxID=3075604 RepID=A0ABU2YB44_9FLAO|nr:alpha/beta hydrolase [Constantimarinum sp. W242]MDT0555410.1 alpha/beta hydrolase [Constantimarinum sp. W242]